jgi:hypothetical protein
MKVLQGISPEELDGKLHAGQPDTPLLGTVGMQQLFDAHPNLNTEKINALVQTQNENNALVLAKNNTEPYTPTEPYHPATKKYVEDSITESGNVTPEQVERWDSASEDIAEHEEDSGVHIRSATASYDDGVFTLTDLPTTLPDIFTVRFKAPADFAEGDTFIIGSTTLTAKLSNQEPAPDELFKSGAVVTMEVDKGEETAFFKSGGPSWNIFFGEEPPNKSDGLFVELGSRPQKIVFSDFLDAYGAWNDGLAPMPTARSAFAVAAIDSIIYCASGSTANISYTNKFEAYDTASELWSALADAPTSRDALAGVSVGTVMYAIGGAYGTRLGTLEAYDTVSGLWSTLTSMPTARNYLMAEAVESIIYAIGGSSGTISNKVEAYDTLSGLWSEKTGMPTARYNCASAQINNIIYIAGGMVGSGRDDALLAYIPASDIWMQLVPMPTVQVGATGAALGNLMVVTGGATTTGTSYSSQTVAYIPEANLWSNLPAMPTERVSAGGAVVGRAFYVIGGQLTTSLPYLNVVEEYTLGEDYDNDTLVIEPGYSSNRALLFKASWIEQVFRIKNVYLSVDGILEKVSAQTNINNEGWAPIP